MKERNLDRDNLRLDEDWYGNNMAVTCRCGKVYIVSGRMSGGERVCPKCGNSRGVIVGGKDSGGTATVWDDGSVVQDIAVPIPAVKGVQ